MVSKHPSHHAKKRVLLIDAINWSEAYPAKNPLRNVGNWYHRWLVNIRGMTFRVVKAESDLIKEVREWAQGVIISGSPRDAWSDDPISIKLCDVVQECRNQEKPLLGICYGHQILGRALGGRVAPHPEGFELGNVSIQLTSTGLNFPLLNELPSRFEVLQSHRDAVLELPPDCELLATGDFTPIQGFHWHNLLMGVQFHPEMDPEILRFVWSVRRDNWRNKVSFNLDQTLDNLHPTPLAPKVLGNFVNHCMS